MTLSVLVDATGIGKTIFKHTIGRLRARTDRVWGCYNVVQDIDSVLRDFEENQAQHAARMKALFEQCPDENMKRILMKDEELQIQVSNANDLFNKVHRIKQYAEDKYFKLNMVETNKLCDFSKHFTKMQELARTYYSEFDFLYNEAEKQCFINKVALICNSLDSVYKDYVMRFDVHNRLTARATTLAQKDDLQTLQSVTLKKKYSSMAGICDLLNLLDISQQSRVEPWKPSVEAVEKYVNDLKENLNNFGATLAIADTKISGKRLDTIAESDETSS